MCNVLAKQDDTENRSRRYNSLFFGLDDSEKETWDESMVISLCAENPEIEMNPSSIEKAHRIGRHTADKIRPVIVKFTAFKGKQKVLTLPLSLRELTFQ